MAKRNPYEFEDSSDPDIGGGSGNIPGVLTSGTINGIFGMPYQFLPSVDRRVMVGGANDSRNIKAMGRKYAEKVASHMPLLFITPCRQKFMEGFAKSDQESVLNSLLTGNGISTEMGKTGRYYTAEFAYNEYYNCVNKMASQVAHFIGEADTEIETSNGTKQLSKVNWMKDMRNSSFNNYFAAKSAAVFYADGLTTVSDSFSNSTTDSQLASSINGFSDQAKEIRFLTGSNSTLSSMATTARDTISGALGSAADTLGGSLTEGMLGDLASTGVSTVISGGKIIFPKIWGDSQYSKSYSFDIKLRSPDHDNLSIFLNVLLPYIHLLALCMPQSVTEGDAYQSPNAYDTPFIVKAYCKGMFNINMGMITDLSVTRGAESQWNDNGLPTQIDVSLSIEDLYSTLFMTNPKPKDFKEKVIDLIDVFDFNSNFDIATNTEMLDFLSNLSGLNVAAEEITRKAKMVLALSSDSFARGPANISNAFENGIANITRRLFDIIN